MASQVSSQSFNEMVDIILATKGTPRHHLFEYPHRADDSRRMIAEAEAVVRKILNIQERDASSR